MQVNFDRNYSTVKINPSFGAIKFHGGSKDILKKFLKINEQDKFSSLVEKQKGNPIETIICDSGISSSKLVARIISTNRYVNDKNVIQYPFESVIHFMKRVCKKADNLHTKIQAMGYIS